MEKTTENRVAVCCIVKNENRYIREWVEWYKNLGFNAIFIYDNNDVNGEHLEEVINDYKADGYVQIIDYRGKECCQIAAYTECYQNNSKNFDWIAFFDADEFLQLNRHDDIHSFLGQEHFKDCQLIHINWMLFDDNDKVRYEDRPLNERFIRPMLYDKKKRYDFPENNHVKSIVRCCVEGRLRFPNPHTISNEGIVCRDNKGLICEASSAFLPYDFTDAFIKYFYTKTIEEFYWKNRRGFPDIPINVARNYITADYFFKVNKWTKEKEDVWNELMNGGHKTLFCTVHFNTPLFMDALVKSLEMHVPNYHLYVFDNSDKEPYHTDNSNVTIIDNTKGQIINFDEWLKQYPTHLKSTGEVNKWGSAKHCYTIQKCIDIIDRNFILLDSDILLKKDVTDIIDENYMGVGSVEMFRPSLGGEHLRLLPFLCFINVDKIKESNVSYFDHKRMYGLFYDNNGETYDTGGSFLEDIVARNSFKYVDINEYMVHYQGGSWLEDARTKHHYMQIDPDKWLLKYRNLWRSSRNKKVLYTCITGGFDKLMEIKPKEGWDYVCFTDQNITSDTWSIRPLPPHVSMLSTVKKQRFIKLNPHIFFPDYDLSVWADANMEPIGDIDEFVNAQNLNDDKVIALKRHPSRDCIYQEMEACIYWKRETVDNIRLLERYYRSIGYPQHQGMYETNVVVRKHNDKRCIELMTMWTGELLRMSHRDQLSLNYCIWKLKCQNMISEFTYDYCSRYFRWRQHLDVSNTNPEAREKERQNGNAQQPQTTQQKPQMAVQCQTIVRQPKIRLIHQEPRTATQQILRKVYIRKW